MLRPRGLFQHGQTELVILFSLSPLNFTWFSVLAVLYTKPFIFSCRLCSAMSHSSVCLPNKWSVSSTVVSSYLTQWLKRGATSILSHVIKAFQCCHHTSCPDPCCLHLQTCASPIFPAPINEGCHSTDLPRANQLVPESSGPCFPDISQIHLLPFSLAARSLYQPVIICHHSTLSGTWWRFRICLLNVWISWVRTISNGLTQPTRLSDWASENSLSRWFFWKTVLKVQQGFWIGHTFWYNLTFCKSASCVPTWLCQGSYVLWLFPSQKFKLQYIYLTGMWTCSCKLETNLFHSKL